MDLEFFQSEAFIIGYYVLTVGASLLLIKETKKRLSDLEEGKNSMIFAPIAFGILLVYILVAFDFFDSIPILNWSWLGYNIAFGPFADQGLWGILPFIPLLLYMFVWWGHLNAKIECYILQQIFSETQLYQLILQITLRL